MSGEERRCDAGRSDTAVRLAEPEPHPRLQHGPRLSQSIDQLLTGKQSEGPPIIVLRIRKERVTGLKHARTPQLTGHACTNVITSDVEIHRFGSPDLLIATRRHAIPTNTRDEERPSRIFLNRVDAGVQTAIEDIPGQVGMLLPPNARLHRLSGIQHPHRGHEQQPDLDIVGESLVRHPLLKFAPQRFNPAPPPSPLLTEESMWIVRQERPQPKNPSPPTLLEPRDLPLRRQPTACGHSPTPIVSHISGEGRD